MARERKFSSVEIFRETERLLLEVGYEGYTISMLAEALNVSRAAIYKYYTNKEALIVDFMLEHIQNMIRTFRSVDPLQDFEKQLDEILNIVLDSKDLHRILSIAHLINTKNNAELEKKMQTLGMLHKDMYEPLQAMVNRGKEEGYLNKAIPNALIIGFIFQSIDIPNHIGIPNEQFVQSVKQLVLTGIAKTNE